MRGIILPSLSCFKMQMLPGAVREWGRVTAKGRGWSCWMAGAELGLGYHCPVVVSSFSHMSSLEIESSA